MLMRGETMCSTRLLIALLVGVAGCASQQHPLSASAAANLKGRRVTLSARPPTHLYAYPPDKIGPFAYPPGLMGVAMWNGTRTSAGARIMHDNGIVDPAPFMAQMVSRGFLHRLGVQPEPQAIFMTDELPTEIAATHPTADLILDVRIDSLELEPYPRKPSDKPSDQPPKYRLRYEAYLRLIDTKATRSIDDKKGAAIAYVSCQRLPEEEANAPTYDELLANGAERLKREIDIAMEYCAKVFQSEVLTANPPPPQ